jgi:hypothetical protein
MGFGDDQKRVTRQQADRLAQVSDPFSPAFRNAERGHDVAGCGSGLLGRPGVR